MDPLALAFYAAVCATLSLAAPRLGGLMQRILVGAAVGIVASACLPLVRQAVAGF